MTEIDWRELYAANQQRIQAALGGGGGPLAGSSPTTATRRFPSVTRRLPSVARGLLTVLPPAGGQVGLGRGRQPPLVYVPQRLDADKPAPLVCMLHGCTQDPASFAAATRMNDAADRLGFAVVYPGQDRGSNVQGCWNWFLPEHQRRGAGEPAAIAGVVVDLIDAGPGCTIDPARVYVAGLSSGGAMAVILAACYPELFTGVAAHSGLAYRSATDVASAFEAMAGRSRSVDIQGREVHAAMGDRSRPVRSLVIQGSADLTVAPANALEVLRQSMAANHLAAPHGDKHDVARPDSSSRLRSDGGLAYTHSRWLDQHGAPMHELLEIDGLGHAWSGGTPGGSYTDPRGPSATDAICAFFSLTAANAHRVD
jgi:poly(hydroxyalkanoate) depolymerase family esterase